MISGLASAVFIEVLICSSKDGSAENIKGSSGLGTVWLVRVVSVPRTNLFRLLPCSNNDELIPNAKRDVRRNKASKYKNFLVIRLTSLCQKTGILSRMWVRRDSFQSFRASGPGSMGSLRNHLRHVRVPLLTKQKSSD